MLHGPAIKHKTPGATPQSVNLTTKTRFKITFGTILPTDWVLLTNTVYPRISSRGLIRKNEFLGGGLFEEGWLIRGGGGLFQSLVLP